MIVFFRFLDIILKDMCLCSYSIEKYNDKEFDELFDYPTLVDTDFLEPSLF